MSDLFERFEQQQILAQDSKSKTITLLGLIDGKHAIVMAEKSAFDTDNLESITRPVDIIEDVCNNIYVRVYQ